MNSRASKKEPFQNFQERLRVKHQNEVEGDDEPSDPESDEEHMDLGDELGEGEISTPKVKEV